MAICVVLRDYHVDNHARNFLSYFAIKNFALKLSRKVKVFSLAENKPVDIFLQLRLMSMSRQKMSKIEEQVFSGGPDTK